MSSDRTTPIICGGQTFRLPWRVLLSLGPFDNDPSLLKDGYSVQTRCPPATFETFQRFLVESDCQVNRKNALDLLSLAHEFHFEALEEKVMDFINSDRQYFHIVNCQAKIDMIELRMDMYRDECHRLREELKSYNKAFVAIENRRKKHPAMLTDALGRVREAKKSLAELKANVICELDKIRSQIARIRRLMTTMTNDRSV